MNSRSQICVCHVRDTKIKVPLVHDERTTTLEDILMKDVGNKICREINMFEFIFGPKLLGGLLNSIF